MEWYIFKVVKEKFHTQFKCSSKIKDVLLLWYFICCFEIGSQYVALPVLESAEIPLPLPSEWWDYWYTP